jgi:ferredoxin
MTRRHSGPERLRVDPIACDGRGLCGEVLPELITLDDWGFPMIRDGDVPAGLSAAADEAVRVCPKLALRLSPRQEHAEE